MWNPKGQLHTFLLADLLRGLVQQVLRHAELKTQRVVEKCLECPSVLVELLEHHGAHANPPKTLCKTNKIDAFS
jgi:hypothetical protein